MNVSIEQQIKELKAAGWRPWDVLKGHEVKMSTTWLSPSATLYRGPHGAWLAMKGSSSSEPSSDQETA